LGVINQAGFGGTYNYAYLPILHITNELGRGYAIINFTSSLYLEHFVEHIHTPDLQAISDEGHILRCRMAHTQGYSNYVSEKKIRNVLRLKNRRMWPFMATVDGATPILSPWLAPQRRARVRVRSAW